MSIQVALAGNPNCGKTTLFNGLTGATQYVGNWPGVTVEKKEGKYKEDKDIKITDLPGIYSLSPYTLEEVVSREFLLNGNVDVVLNIIDGSNLERNLFLTTQILELGIPTVVAINMLDVIEKRKDTIDYKKLSEELGCPVLPISALKNTGIKELMAQVKKAAGTKFSAKNIYAGKVLNALNTIETSLPSSIEASRRFFYAVKLFERDDKIEAAIKSKADASVIEACEKSMDDDSESIITDARYTYITSVIKDCYKKGSKEVLTTSDKIDRIVTNRVLALPIFALVMWFVYYISVTTVGTIVTDWTNDVLFGEIIPPAVDSFLDAIQCADWLHGLIVDGIIGGVGAVIGFVPQMLVLFFFLAILEDCGYMARVAFIMDRIFRKFGLSGKSFIPMLIGTGCGVPAVMASRTIESDRDRKMTIMTTTFIPCGAKMPIIGLIAGAIFHGASWVAPSAYFVGMAAVIVSGIMLKKTKLFAGDPAPFVMEMPAYHMPRAVNVLRSMWERGSSFIKKAGTIILLSTIVLWFLQGFGWEKGAFGMVDDIDHSILSSIGQTFAWIFSPLGWGDWKAAVASVTGLIAKENVVATFGQLYGFAEVAEEGNEFWGQLSASFTPLAAYSFMVFNLLCAPCFAAMGAIKREMNNTKWFWIAIGYQCGFAYVCSLIVYQLGSLVNGGSFGFGAIVGFILLIGLIYLLVRPSKESDTAEVEFAVK
ncbi:ferrous iron transport protein B [Holdemanella biformis]|jgi:ferrous iron transport protein B|uniref:ferrous iron transport protein B n=1 Tax=Holdemanella biformis TaxID=1735 RepID=UPI001C3814BF|nr:ferrous iron transport protein B [Holdemanella biformis]MBV4130908.1 ferrous iron transport protein B [Holdemanella biformis]MBV4150646.1 ferrous iron transport protein B [Holdemanella biformis]MEE0668524.1 ferrous iron transport protein B [Holdemanella biformis]